jgi:CheY-like chemotaxis protein
MKRVLVVDDDRDLRDALADLLGGEGFHVTCAGNGREALDSLASAPCDVILLDYMMPEMHGGEFRAAQRALPQIAAIPVILASAACSAPAAAAIEPAAVLRKPFTPAALLDSLEQVLGAEKG